MPNATPIADDDPEAVEEKPLPDLPAAVKVAIEPALIFALPGLPFITVLLTIVFLALLVRRVDNNDFAGQPWASTVFIPIWILFCIYGALLLPVICDIPTVVRHPSKDGKLKALLLLKVVARIIGVALVIASGATICQALDGRISWAEAWTPIFLLVGLEALWLLTKLDNESFTRKREGGENMAVRRAYVIHIISRIAAIACMLAFTLLLYRNIAGSDPPISYGVVFIPFLIFLAIPIFDTLFSVKDDFQICRILITIFLAVFPASFAFLLAWKCENARTGAHEAFPSLATVFIPIYIPLAFAVVLFGFSTQAALSKGPPIGNEKREAFAFVGVFALMAFFADEPLDPFD